MDIEEINAHFINRIRKQLVQAIEAYLKTEDADSKEMSQGTINALRRSFFNLHDCKTDEEKQLVWNDFYKQCDKEVSAKRRNKKAA